MKVNIQKNKLFFSILFFIIFYVVIIVIKPSILFLPNGEIRSFGLGFQNKTIIPIWLFTIILAIISYMIILFIIGK